MKVFFSKARNCDVVKLELDEVRRFVEKYLSGKYELSPNWYLSLDMNIVTDLEHLKEAKTGKFKNISGTQIKLLED